MAAARSEVSANISTWAPATATDCGSITLTVSSEARAEREKKNTAKNWRQERITPPLLAKGVGV
jgi:hypothetical protein